MYCYGVDGVKSPVRVYVEVNFCATLSPAYLIVALKY